MLSFMFYQVCFCHNLISHFCYPSMHIYSSIPLSISHSIIKHKNTASNKFFWLFSFEELSWWNNDNSDLCIFFLIWNDRSVVFGRVRNWSRYWSRYFIYFSGNWFFWGEVPGWVCFWERTCFFDFLYYSIFSIILG